MINFQNQHWVPKFLLKNFVDADGKVFRLNVVDDRITKLSPRRSASRPNFNILLANGVPKSFENEFEKLETAAARPLADVVHRRSLTFLTRLQRTAIARFVAAQSFRTEAYRLGLRGNRANLDLGTAMELMLVDIDQLAGLLDVRKWALMVTSERNPFYLGDNPVVLQKTEHPGEAGELGFDMAGVEAFIPLSPVCALYMICPRHGREIVDGYRNALRINVAALAGIELEDFDVSSALPIARRVLGSTQPIYQAITHGSALAADDKNVENLNYLQCAWASSGIYSNFSDFAFAQRVFRENPQYRGIMPARIHRTTGRLRD